MSDKDRAREIAQKFSSPECAAERDLPNCKSGDIEYYVKEDLI